MIISGGMNIYPVDLERVIIQHPQVADAAVVGLPDERWGETPVAVVEVLSAKGVSAEDLRSWANGRLGKYQRISRVDIWEELPRNAMRKVLKAEIVETLRSGNR